MAMHAAPSVSYGSDLVKTTQCLDIASVKIVSDVSDVSDEL